MGITKKRKGEREMKNVSSERIQGQHYRYMSKKNVACKGFWGLSRMIVVCMMAMLLFLSVEQSQATEKYVTIVNSPEVKQKLQQASPVERKRMEKAIKNGNRFIQLRFNDEDTYFYDDPDGDEVWKKKMAPIMSMSLEKWQNYRNARWEKVTNATRTRSGYELVSCPEVELKQLHVSSYRVALVYSAVIIGKFSTFGGVTHGEIDTTRLGSVYELEISVGINSKITSEHSLETQLATSYQEYYRFTTFRLNKLLSIKNKSEIVKNDISSINDTLNKLNSLLNNCKKQ